MNKKNFNPLYVNKRSNIKCSPKNILKNKYNDFTIDIHWVKNKKEYEIDIDYIYFFHFKTLSIKNRQCECFVDCLVESSLT
jgi:hypothetical protein